MGERDTFVEVRANAFGACFLMPEDGLRQFVASLGKGEPSRGHADVFDGVTAIEIEGRTAPGSQEIQVYDVVQLAHRFGVSEVAAIYRLHNLDLLKSPQRDALLAAANENGDAIRGSLGLKAPAKPDAGGEIRHRVLGLALEAYRRELITQQKLRELGEMVAADRKSITALLRASGLDEED